MARVLLVDDDADALELRKLIFEREGHQVDVACDARGARERFSANPPEGVILDLRLPEAEDGFALIREFRAAAPEVKIVVLAGWIGDLEGRSERGLVDRVLSKPVRSDKLLRALEVG